jgi:hypothetical protein
MSDQFSREALRADAAAILAHPNFAAARRRHTDTGLAVADGEPVVAKLICQTSRYATMALILSLEDLRDGNPASGATPGKLLAVIGRTPFASISWAKLMVRVFHRAGLVEYAPPGPDRRVRPFYPSPKLIDMGQEAITIFLEALGEVQPLPAPAAELARRPGMLTGFARVMVDTFFVHRFSMLEPFPITDELFKRDFGYLIYAHLMQTMQTGDDGVVRASAPASDMQKRYGVSRATVRNFLAFAEEKGLLVPEGKAGHVLRCTAEFVSLTNQWSAMDLAWLSYLLRTTLARLEVKEAQRAA